METQTENERVEIEGKLVRETDKAVCLKTTYGQMWFPRSRITLIRVVNIAVCV